MIIVMTPKFANTDEEATIRTARPATRARSARVVQFVRTAKKTTTSNPPQSSPQPGLDFCPYCGSDHITDIDYPLPAEAPDLLRCDKCESIWEVGPPATDEATDDAEAMAMLVRIYRTSLTISADFSTSDFYTLIALVQLAARTVLPPDHSLQPFARQFVTQACQRLSEICEEPQLIKYVEMGWNPAHDEPRRT